jgi:hypothetical protein
MMTEPRIESVLPSHPKVVRRSLRMKWARIPEVTTARLPIGVTCRFSISGQLCAPTVALHRRGKLTKIASVKL